MGDDLPAGQVLEEPGDRGHPGGSPYQEDLVDVVPDKSIVKYIRSLTRDINYRHDLPHQFTNERLSAPTIRFSDFTLFTIHADDGTGYIVVLGFHQHVANGT